MKEAIYVVTGLDLGWDCVVGVFKGVSYEELEERFGEGYVVHEQFVYTDLKEFD